MFLNQSNCTLLIRSFAALRMTKDSFYNSSLVRKGVGGFQDLMLLVMLNGVKSEGFAEGNHLYVEDHPLVRIYILAFISV
ncbi:MAG: hypothetical protein HXX16_03160 [Bacteroidales bacterium]|nr:hypothetical protein [Bacteroidales bacterium]